MAEGETSSLSQGFIILMVENCRACNWARIYLSKIIGEKKVKTCGPDRMEIFGAAEDLLLECHRVVLLTRAYPVGAGWESLIREIEREYPKIEVVRMPHT